MWRIGTKNATSDCYGGQSPGLDHSPDATNTLLGTMIGQCLVGRIRDWDCVFSPDIDLRNAEADTRLRFWRSLQTQASPIIQHKIMFKNADGSWATVMVGFNEPVWDQDWQPMSFPVKSFRHRSFAVAICLAHLSPSLKRKPIAGWSLDDFSLAPAACSEGL